MDISSIEPYITKENITFDGVYKITFSNNETMNATINLVPGVLVFKEDVVSNSVNINGKMVQLRSLNGFYSRFAAGINLGVKNICMGSGSRVLYVGTRNSVVSISYVSDIVGEAGMVYVVGVQPILNDLELGDLPSKRSNVERIGVGALYTSFYKERVGKIDVIVYDVDSTDEKQVENLALIASNIIKDGGYFITFIRAKVEATFPPTPDHFVFKSEKKKLEEHQFKIVQSFSLEQCEKYCLFVVGSYPAV